KIEIDRKFFFSIIPFIVLGGFLRALEDYYEFLGIGKNIFLITPLIYVSIFLLALASLVFSKLAERWTKTAYYKIWFALGVIFNIIVISQMRMQSIFALYAMLGIAAAWIIAIIAARKVFSKNGKIHAFLSRENTFLIAVHMFDATTTFVALQFFPSYFEQHVVPSLFISILGPASMFLLKLIVVPLVLYVLDKELSKEAQKRTFLKIVVMILGLAPGLRNFSRLVMGV
ncbi:MAG: DUF63 family protein, partial [Candidatus Aenigmarchaeota archaeon]|nr:DUF63 family protein [Candidatus Aenigmarchaeota archaeon]MDI6722505.1 DUF63 family protein [Candidatus Aenigmarchaeota archaeon]